MEQNDRDHNLRIKEQSEKQYKLIQQLKSQLEDLENYAYEVWKPLALSHSNYIYHTTGLVKDL